MIYKYVRCLPKILYIEQFNFNLEIIKQEDNSFSNICNAIKNMEDIVVSAINLYEILKHADISVILLQFLFIN